MSEQRNSRKTRIGVVTSDKRDKTITVLVTESKLHPLYGKTIPTRSRFHAHDPGNEARVGDTVRIMESRPLSKTVRWRLVEVVERAR